MSDGSSLDVRWVVLSKDDIYSGLRQLTKALAGADTGAGATGVLSLRLPRGARWTVRAEETDSANHLVPMMFYVSHPFVSQDELVAALRKLAKSLHRELPDDALESERNGRIYGSTMENPIGAWHLSRLVSEKPNSESINGSDAWDPGLV
jgi:hypothetical protein